VDLRVVLVAPRNPLNIGAAARAMANFGFTTLRLVNPYELAFREARSAVGAASILAAAEEFGSLAQAVGDCELVAGATAAARRQLQHPLHRLEAGAQLIRNQPGPVALVFGSEKFGLSNEDMSHCHWLMRIPTADFNLSMNLGQAVAVCLYELIREPGAQPQPGRRKPAKASDIEQITRLLLETLTESGYLNPVTAESSEQKIRRLVRRFDIAAEDAPMILGILRQALWRFRAPRA
jgi:tRNA/rRNA methyltransferase